MSSHPNPNNNNSDNNSNNTGTNNTPHLNDQQEAALQAHLSLFPTVDDLPAGIQVIRLNNFSLEDHLRKTMFGSGSSSRAGPSSSNALSSRNRAGLGSGIPSGKERASRDALARKKLKSNPFVPPADGKCPVNGLPNELLAYIFTLGAEAEQEGENDEEEDEEDEEFDWDEDESDEDDEDERRDLEFQVLVSHVCRRWREVAIQVRFQFSLVSYLSFH